ncbi:Pantoate--beta-alanine ligase (AMP-forming) [Lentibacillus sp. JNUCC-1]|uniref:DMT family transporter n=1 Tax=Lentibacillus sp. JNUCC-1 TaxID=2654513 RepID=UPI0012E72051|nr:DMT family transporter [Lentibacillus sp. JNUCC-1]MUV36476.1 Pantoate--beta-alanine ligase (AMP-forming) [Lentibacillus sp. JNUCC-1]
MYWYVLLIFVVIFYAGNLLVGRDINALPPFTIAFSRLVIAFIVLLPLGWHQLRRLRPVYRTYKKPFFLMALTGVALFNTLIYAALQFTTSTNAAVLESSVPVVTVIASAFLIKERLNILQWLGVLLSLFGAIWVVLDGNLSDVASLSWNVGDALMIGALLCWSAYSILIKKYMHLFPAYGALLAMTGVAVLLLLPFVVFEWLLTGIPVIWTPGHMVGLVYLGVFPSVIALIFYNKAVSHLGASRASIFLNFLPVVTMIGAYLWLGEEITLMHVTGTICVIGGVILTTRQREKNSNPVDG